MALNAVADTKPSSVTGSSYLLPVRLSVTVREPTPPPGASRIFWSAPARWVKTGGAPGESRGRSGQFGGLRPAGKKRPFAAFFARAGSGRGTRGVLTGGGRVPLDRVALIVRRAQVAGQMANPFARPRLVRHGVKCRCFRMSNLRDCVVRNAGPFHVEPAGRCGPSLGARGYTGRARLTSARRRRMETRVGGLWSRRAVCLCPASWRGLSRSGRVLSQSSFLSRFSPYTFCVFAGHRQRGLGPLRRPEERHHSSTQAPSTHLRACRRSSPSSSRPWSHRAPRRTKAETGAKVALRPLPLRGIAPFKASVKRLLTPPHGRLLRSR